MQKETNKPENVTQSLMEEQCDVETYSYSLVCDAVYTGRLIPTYQTIRYHNLESTLRIVITLERPSLPILF